MNIIPILLWIKKQKTCLLYRNLYYTYAVKHRAPNTSLAWGMIFTSGYKNNTIVGYFLCLCTFLLFLFRSLRCPQHTDAMRRAVRAQLLHTPRYVCTLMVKVCVHFANVRLYLIVKVRVHLDCQCTCALWLWRYICTLIVKVCVYLLCVYFNCLGMCVLSMWVLWLFRYVCT